MTTIPYLGQKALRVLESATRFGTLTVITPEGVERTFSGPNSGPHGIIRIKDWRTINAALAQGDIGLGNAYMAGWWESPDLENLLTVLMLNMDGLGRLAWGSFLHRIRSVVLEWVFRRNSVKGSQRNIMAHYDVGNDFYSRWLDPSMTYSSAIFGQTGYDLESAQKAKYARILERIGGNHGSVLEIGCGWGGFTEAAVRQGHDVTALTISPRQHAYATERVGKAADIKLQDYRKQGGTFSSIVSIEMFEAVGERYWPTYFQTVRERLTSNGVAVVQTISISEQLFPSYRTSSDYIRHHIFPGGMLPSVSRFKQEAERAGLGVQDVFSFGQCYARTCREWLQRFDAALPEIRALGYEEGFLRGWRLYLAMCAGAFALGRTNVHQFELVPVRS
ncbi:MAG: cyclopropane-fatty-acyl-phospholipid synthase family protein [Hyphomicrobium sp.]|nr:cyclopropane-fatty-acyl-phospholipid synthase family protein [Hyphomicrobium sp.]